MRKSYVNFCDLKLLLEMKTNYYHIKVLASPQPLSKGEEEFAFYLNMNQVFLLFQPLPQCD